MKTIWKFPVYLSGRIEIEMPVGAEIISFENQYSSPCLWALVDSEAPTETRYFQTRATGQDCSGLRRQEYIGSVSFDGGEFILHCFEHRGA